MGKISVHGGGSDKLSGDGMPVPVNGTNYDDTPGVNGPPPAAEDRNAHRIVTATEVTDDATTTQVVEAGRVSGDSETERRPAPRKATDAAASRGTTRK